MRNTDILIIAHFTDPSRGSNNRFRELAHVLSRRGAAVELVTSSFDHQSKTQRDLESEETTPFSITHIQEPTYSANISLGRIRSHVVMARNLAEYLDTRATPDVIYCAMPSDAVASVANEYAELRGVRLILDVQDLWPEAFEMVLKPRPLARWALTPLRIRANQIYRKADGVVTVSDTYSDRVREARGGKVSTTYLGTNLKAFDTFAASPRSEEKSEHPEAPIRLAYVGTLGHSYDLPVVFDAIRNLTREKQNVELHVMGSGPLEEKWRADTKDLSKEVIFHGLLAYPEMVSLLNSCDIALNPIMPGAAQSIVNKVCDYAAAGLPVVSTQECEEYRHLLQEFQAGISCPPNPGAVATALKQLIADPELRQNMGEGSRRLAERHFDREVTYERLADLVLS